jgi:hypothetical protein
MLQVAEMSLRTGTEGVSGISDAGGVCEGGDMTKAERARLIEPQERENEK